MSDLTMSRIRFILIGAVIGLTWAASLRGMMMALAGADSTFTFTGTFGIIISTGVVVGALLGWAEHQRRTGHQHGLLILTPLLIGVVPLVLTSGIDPAPIGLALLAMVGGYSVSGRGPLWSRIVAGGIALANVAAPFPRPQTAPGPQRDHSVRRLVRHPGVVPVRHPRPGQLHPHAPAGHKRQPHGGNVHREHVRPSLHPASTRYATPNVSRGRTSDPERSTTHRTSLRSVRAGRLGVGSCQRLDGLDHTRHPALRSRVVRTTWRVAS